MRDKANLRAAGFSPWEIRRFVAERDAFATEVEKILAADSGAGQVRGGAKPSTLDFAIPAAQGRA